MCLFKCITGLVSENFLAVNALTSPKNSWNLKKSTLIVHFHHCEWNWVRKSFFESDLRYEDCLITLWLPTTSIVVVRGRIYRYKYTSIYPEKLNLSSDFLFILLESILNFQWSEKNQSDGSSISEVIDSERCAYLNAKQTLCLKTFWQWTW